MEFRISASDFVGEHEGKFKDHYKLGKKLGEGGTGCVRVVRHRTTQEKRAVKIINKRTLKTEDEQVMLLRELAVLRTLDHPNIVKLYEFFQDEKSCYIVTDRCSGGELFEKIIEDGNFTEATAANYMKQLLGALAYLHDRCIAHRDLKPENFLLSSKHQDSGLKLVDFGSAQQFEPGAPMTYRTGTPYYIAPEVLTGQYTEACDLWSAGVCMYIMLCGMPPFNGRTEQEIFNAVKTSRLHFPSPEWDSISFEAKDLVSKLLTREPSYRLSAQAALQHSWLSHASHLPLNQQVASKYLSNLRTFRSEQLLQKATMAFISSQLTSQQEREELGELFASLDADHNGRLSREELVAGFEQFFGQADDVEAEVERIMKAVDIDESGEIDYSEFITAALDRNALLSNERLKLAFNSFDVDKSGAISAEELKNVLGKYSQCDETVWHSLIREVDDNGDGEIDFKEFRKMMEAILNT